MFDSGMDDVITIKRRTLGAENTDGDMTAGWADIVTAGACRTYYKDEIESDIGGGGIVKTVYKVLINSVNAILEHDLVLIGAKNYDIVKVITKDGFTGKDYELTLEAVSH